MIWKPQKLPYPHELETLKVLKLLPEAHRALAELKGVAQSIPTLLCEWVSLKCLKLTF